MIGAGCLSRSARETRQQSRHNRPQHRLTISVPWDATVVAPAGAGSPQHLGRILPELQRVKEPAISNLLERLREREWRLTPQRRVGENVHLTAEAIHLQSQSRLPEISLATVYNTLNELVAMGEVLEVAAGNGPKRYDPNVTVAHQHLVCTACGTLRDVFSMGDGMIELCDDDRHGFVVTGIEIVFQGLCPACAEARDHPVHSA
jgi:Fur family transcriptional regulator, stress-responsive regulator